MQKNQKFQTIFFALFLIAVSSVGAYSQTMIDAIERVRAIKFLESDRSDVRQVLHEMIYDGSFENRDDFTYGTFDVEIYYSTGECDEDEDEIFQAEKGAAIRVLISPSDEMLINQLGFDLTKLRKEQRFHDMESAFVYHDKKSGFAVKVNDDEVEEIILFPPINSRTKPCGNDKAREFVKLMSWFGGTKLEDRTGTISCGNRFANVTDVQLSAQLITAISSKRINVATIAVDPENDVLTYNYIISVGKIAGIGKTVVWDLTGVPAGSYTLTAWVDDGCGLCGQTKTKTVTVQ